MLDTPDFLRLNRAVERNHNARNHDALGPVTAGSAANGDVYRYKEATIGSDGVALLDEDCFRTSENALSILNDIITGIDHEAADLYRDEVLCVFPYFSDTALEPSKSIERKAQKTPRRRTKETRVGPQENIESRVNRYANAKLPPRLLPFKAYPDTWRIICLAAQASDRVYSKPIGEERDMFIKADRRHGTKAFVIKSVTTDDKSHIIVAIRGSQSFSDWAVNFNRQPSSPSGFLDDDGNLVHSGFLGVARSMVEPLAELLRQEIVQQPSRSSCSLIITGHSAGGAVAALLYMHMLSQTVRSSLTFLTEVFRHVHCVTFGAPPVSLLPLQKPNAKRYAKSMFFSFVNQGDLVTRASSEYLAGLIKLYLTPLLKRVNASTQAKRLMPAGLLGIKKHEPEAKLTQLPYWDVPASALSNAGRLVLLRETHKPGDRGAIEACGITDGDLRFVIFGDPAMHAMRVYKQRVEELAKLVITGKDRP